MAELYEVVLETRYQSQVCINRWNYLLNGTPAAVAGSFGLAAAFGGIYDLVAVPPGYPSDTVLSHIMGILNIGVTAVQMTVINVFDPVDFYQVPFVVPYAGQATGEGVSPTVAFGFRSTQVRRDIGRGTKRFVGVGETLSGAGGVITAPALAVLGDIATAMSETIVYDDEGNTLSYQPCIAQKEKYATSIAPNGGQRYAYKYYDEAEQFEHLAVGIAWEPYTTTRTQVSRQYGRGR